MGRSPEQDRPVRVLALTRTNCAHTFTWRLRVEVLLPYLAGQGIEVETRRLPREPAEFAAFCREQRGHDVLWLHRLIFWPSELRLLAPMARHMVLDIDDPICYSSSRPFNFSLTRCLRFRATVRRCAAVLAASDGLVELAQALHPHVVLVRLCAEPERYVQRPCPRRPGEPLRLLWLGARSTFKYLAQARPHLEAIGRRCPEARLIVVGHSRLELRHLSVQNVPWSPDSEAEALRSSHLGLVPMKADRWTRAKAALKPMQYLASGMPFLGHPVGVNVHLADGGRNGLLAGRPAEWGAAVAALAGDEERRLRMGGNGVEYIRRFHTAEVLAARVARTFRAIRAGEPLAGAA
jgi:glycosyltransferase involved in cell wall biosynthesis